MVGPLPTYAKQTTTKSTLRGKKIVEVPESVGLTRKPEQVYGLILEDDDDDNDDDSDDDDTLMKVSKICYFFNAE